MFSILTTSHCLEIVEVYLCATAFCFECSEVISEVCPLLSKGFPCLHTRDISLKCSMLWSVKTFSSKILKHTHGESYGHQFTNVGNVAPPSLKTIRFLNCFLKIYGPKPNFHKLKKILVVEIFSITPPTSHNTEVP